MDKQNSRKSQFFHSLGDAFNRLKMLLIHPRFMYESDSIRQLDAAIVILLLILLTGLQKILWAAQSHIPIGGYEIIRQVFLGVLLGWGGLSSLFYFIGRLTKKEPDFIRLAVWVAAAGLPLVITTFVSVVVMGFCLVLNIGGNIDTWQQVHNVIGWIGLVLGWPGWFSALALRRGLDLKWRSALIICGVLLAFLVAGTLLPVLIQ